MGEIGYLTKSPLFLCTKLVSKEFVYYICKMEELKKALELRAKYNRMSLNNFIKKLESYLGFELQEDIKNDWEYTGLTNIDLFKEYVKCNI